MASIETPESAGQHRGHKQKKWQIHKRLGFRIDMTPYVDVIMLLLTFFIMTTTLNQPQVMQINLPKGDETEKVKVDMGNVVFIRVSEKGNIGISRGKSDGTEEQPVKIEFNKMREYLERLGAANKDMIMILKFDRKAKYHYMVDVLDEINRATIEKRYSFSKMEDEDKRVIEAIGG
ncbi:MAG: ExbD/TolR family protein [Ignavibacteria bacterium]